MAENRRRAARFLGLGDPSDWVPMRQVHGTRVLTDDPADHGGTHEADAVVVTRPGRTGVVLTADCAPLALISEEAVAAVHGGWRGLLDGVVEAAARALAARGGAVRHALLGPCIHPCCYEFGPDDLDVLVERFGEGVRSTTTAGRPALDLPAAVRAAVARAGIGVAVRELRVCTACDADSFSHRRDGETGRQGLLVARLASRARP